MKVRYHLFCGGIDNVTQKKYAMVIIDLEINWAPETQNAVQIREFSVRTVLKQSGKFLAPLGALAGLDF